MSRTGVGRGMVFVACGHADEDDALDPIGMGCGEREGEQTSHRVPDEALRAWLDAHTRIFEHGRPLLRVMLRAMSEPAVAELAAEGDRHRRSALDHVIRRFADADRLRPDLDTDTAVDQAWALSSVASTSTSPITADGRPLNIGTGSTAA